ncbi:hypothetical protein JL721_7497 [Aureococcus anophagefferens]|nr:hypothetical protein JL721_7497 [Aureococcus anophagefferens]
MAPLRTGRGRTDETTTTKLTRNQKKRKRRKQDKDDLQDELDRVKAENARLKGAARHQARKHDARRKRRRRRRDDDDDDNDDEDDTPICRDFNNGGCSWPACRYRHVADGGRPRVGAYSARSARHRGQRRAG